MREDLGEIVEVEVEEWSHQRKNYLVSVVLSPVYSHLKSRMNEVEKCRYYFVVLASIKDVGNITSIYNKYKNKIKGCMCLLQLY